MTTFKSKISEKELIEFQKRRYARIKVQNAIKTGKLVRSDSCNLCFEKTFVEAHHVDYGKPFSIMWLCSPCHGKAHKKNSKLNPDNNIQTPMCFIAENNQTVTVSFTIPLKNFLAIQKKSENTKTPIAKIIRNEIIKKFPVVNDQLDLFEGVNFDKSQTMSNTRIQCMEQDEKLLLQQKYTGISKVRSPRHPNMPDMERKLLNIFEGDGRHAGKLQWSKAN